MLQFKYVRQFYRTFPRPKEVREFEMDLLVRKYRDPDRPGLINYMNLSNDLIAITKRESAGTTDVHTTRPLGDFLAPYVSACHVT